jgi:hypothetical protein
MRRTCRPGVLILPSRQGHEYVHVCDAKVDPPVESSLPNSSLTVNSSVRHSRGSACGVGRSRRTGGELEELCTYRDGTRDRRQTVIDGSISPRRCSWTKEQKMVHEIKYTVRHPGHPLVWAAFCIRFSSTPSTNAKVTRTRCVSEFNPRWLPKRLLSSIK